VFRVPFLDLLSDLDTAVGLCKPPQQIIRSMTTLEPLHRYVLHLLHNQLTPSTVEKVILYVTNYS